MLMEAGIDTEYLPVVILYFYFLRQSLSLNPEFIESARVADQRNSGTHLSLFLPQHCGSGVCHGNWLFVWIMEIQTQVLLLEWQATIPTESSLQPKFMFYPSSVN